MAGVRAEVTLLEGKRFRADMGSGYSFHLDVSPSQGGTGDGARPMELLLAGLAGCTAVDVVDILRKSRQPLTGLRVKVTGERADDFPKVYTHIQVTYLVQGKGLSQDAVKRAIKLSEDKYCSASAMLGAVAKIESSYEITEG